MHTTESTPLSRNTGTSSLYRGRCVDEHVGVNAPGSEKTTTVLPANRSSVVIVFQSLFSRMRKVTLGTRWPSRFCSIMMILLGGPDRMARGEADIGKIGVGPAEFQYFVKIGPIGSAY